MSPTHFRYAVAIGLLRGNFDNLAPPRDIFYLILHFLIISISFFSDILLWSHPQKIRVILYMNKFRHLSGCSEYSLPAQISWNLYCLLFHI